MRLGLLLVSPLYFYISFLLKNSYVEINKDKIVLINHKSNNIEIIVSEIQSILIPSEKSVKSKVKGNPIIIKHKDKQNIISYSVEIEEIERDYCEPSSFDSKQFKLLERIMHENFPDVIVAPFLLTAGTDARRFTDVADSILRFAPIDLDKKQYASIHSANEHIKIRNIGECVCFYKDFITNYN